MSLKSLMDAECISVGTKQTSKAVQEGRALTVFIAADAEERIAGELKGLCEENLVPIEEVASMAELGKACGIQVGSAAAAVIVE